MEIRAVNAMIENVEKFLFEDKFKPEQRLYHAIEYFFVTGCHFAVRIRQSLSTFHL